MQPLLSPVDNTRVRLFQQSDSESIRELYMEAMLYGPNSPANLALKHQLRRPFSFLLYGIFTLGIILSRRSPTRIPGALLSTATTGLFFAWRRNIWTRFKIFFQSALMSDLADIGKQYGSHPSAFWVAEVTDNRTAGKIIGCIGLDSSTRADPTTAELRRMVVSPTYQRRGIGSLLFTTVIAHARERGLSTVFLSTSMYQKAAMQVYEQSGFIEEKRVEVTVKFLFIVSKAYLHFYGLKI